MYLSLASARIVYVLAVLFCAAWSASPAIGQVVVDKTVAVVSDGVGRELITLSDLKWQLALQPQKPIDPPTQADLDEALRTLIDQNIFALEAQRVPRNAPTEDEIRAEIDSILRYFPSTSEFERRLRLVGFDSIRDDNFEQLIAKRLSIEKYIDFRFRSFAIVTREDEQRYFENVFIPDFRRRNPGRVVPTFDEVRETIGRDLIENAVAENIAVFLDQARFRVNITYLNGNER